MSYTIRLESNGEWRSLIGPDTVPSANAPMTEAEKAFTAITSHKQAAAWIDEIAYDQFEDFDALEVWLHGETPVNATGPVMQMVVEGFAEACARNGELRGKINPNILAFLDKHGADEMTREIDFELWNADREERRHRSMCAGWLG